MLSSLPFVLPLLGSFVNAANLWATHYTGTINYLTFSGASLSLTSSTRTGNNLPSWITYDSAAPALYISDEVFYGPPSGSLVSFSVDPNGSLTSIGTCSTYQGAVASTMYGGSDGKAFIAQAHYQTSQVATFKLPLAGGAPLETFKYTMATHGPNKERQDAPHPHHAFGDPSGEYLLFTDLGADLIRIYKIEKTTGKLSECPSGKPAPGTGPRHGAFWTPSGATSRVRRGAGAVLFVANELVNTVSSWDVSYPVGGCLTLKLKQTLTPYEGNSTAARGTMLGEIRVKDNSLYTSNRNDKKFAPNDSMTQYTIHPNGSFSWTETTSSYGSYPRTFDINKAGDFVAIGDQTTSNVAIVARDTVTGKLGPRIADLRVGATGIAGKEDGLSAVVWAE